MKRRKRSKANIECSFSYNCIVNRLQHTIWVLDDDMGILSSLEILLTSRFDTVVTWSEPNKMLEALKKTEPDLILMDMNYSRGKVDGQEGLAVLSNIKQDEREIPTVVMTAFSDVQLAVESMKMGAADFVNKPWSNERLLITLLNVLKLQSSQKELLRWKAHSKSETTSEMDLGMVGTSKEMEEVRSKIRKLATSGANVLILGENGTGKELVANAIHKLSDRVEHPFVKIDLGSIPRELFESELFGAKKGAFTGAMVDKPGRMSLAQGGTLFLDEIGNLSLNLQSKLLSVLQNREVTPLGGTKPEQIDVRLVAATNMEVAKLHNPDVFRQDLLYRINTVEINLPALRERRTDVPDLIHHFLRRFEIKYKKLGLTLGEKGMEEVMHYAWPGNIRELEHAVERAVIMVEGNVIQARDLLPQMHTEKRSEAVVGLNLAQTEEHLIKEALKKHAGNITKASKELGITRTALYRRLEKYGL